MCLWIGSIDRRAYHRAQQQQQLKKMTSFPIGSNIVLQNLIAGAKYNGLRGVVKSNIDATSLRQNVFIVDVNIVISVKTANIRHLENDIDNDVSTLSIKQLKTELHSYNISTESYLDKESLVDAVRTARSEGWRRPEVISEGNVDGKKRAATTASTAEDKSKKKKTTDETTMNCGILDKLPDGLLEVVASYLYSSTEKSRSLSLLALKELQFSCLSFAQAMTHSHQNIMSFQPSKTTLAIMKQNKLWEMLDFKYIAEYLEREVTDNDVRWLLQCIDVVNHVKTLRLTHCYGVTGVGLQPLVGSIVLETVDLSLVDTHESPTINTKHLISASEVMPMLNSIINTEGNSLLLVHLPEKWGRCPLLNGFFKRFDRVLKKRNIKCEGNCQDTVVDNETLVDDNGTNTCTCSGCTGSFCTECKEIWELNWCDSCERMYCDGCSNMMYCEPCGKTSCADCGDVKQW